ncbi:MAG: phospholipid/cholesterol/gamma-HCH transport system substrate-binding protein [Candidatus Azotimanducaceae bacterium]|jgi:phospholipid/cholesterol/gamma-HCH transport system substrate-binding protein
MQMRTIEIVVGTFLLAGLISLAILAIRVSGFTVNPDQQTYTVIAKFDNIGGLVVRSKVSIAGVIVGTVTDISLDQRTFMAEVVMNIDADVNEISSDTTAAILTEGLLGGKFIGLSIGAEEDYLKDGDEIYDTQSAIILEELIGQFLLDQF